MPDPIRPPSAPTKNPVRRPREHQARKAADHEDHRGLAAEDRLCRDEHGDIAPRAPVVGCLGRHVPS